MEFIYAFTVLMVLSGFLFTIAAWKLYQVELLKKEMREKEKEIIKKFNPPESLIVRVES